MPEHPAAGATGAPSHHIPPPDMPLLRQGDIGVVNRPFVKCRGWMSAHATETGKLRRNNKVELLSDPMVSSGESWVKIRSVIAGTEGFLPLRFLDVKEIRTARPLALDEHQWSPALPDASVCAGDMCATTQRLRLRAAPGLAGEITAGVPSNSCGRVLSEPQTVDDLVWIEVQLPDRRGWLAARFTRVLARGGKWIEVDLSSQTLTAWNDTEPVSTSAISSGKPGFRTPTGVFAISTKWPTRCAVGSKDDESWSIPAVPWVMVFRSGGFYIHGVYWHDDFGQAVSHGCVTLPVSYAEWLYGWTPPGTAIWIHAQSRQLSPI